MISGLRKKNPEQQGQTWSRDRETLDQKESELLKEAVERGHVLCQRKREYIRRQRNGGFKRG